MHFPFESAFCILPGRMNVVYRFFSTLDSFGPTVLRLLLTVVFTVHGARETFGLFGGPGWAATLAHWTSAEGLNMPYSVAAGILATEIVGAMGLLLGFLTRLAAAGIFSAMVVAAISALHPTGGILASQGIEYTLTLAAVALALMFMGGGRFSFDKAITRQLLPPYTGMLLS